MDDELNILPCSTLVKYIVPLEVDEEGRPLGDASREKENELVKLKDSLEDAQVDSRQQWTVGIGSTLWWTSKPDREENDIPF